MRENFDVVVIGGGTTGTGVIRDLVLRGFPNSLLLERDDWQPELQEVVIPHYMAEQDMWFQMYRLQENVCRK